MPRWIGRDRCPVGTPRRTCSSLSERQYRDRRRLRRLVLLSGERGCERSQLLLLPKAIDDYVVADNPVRFIDAFVGGLDLAAAGIKR